MTRTALLSVYDKTGIVEFATSLVELGWTLYASGGTCAKLAQEGVPVTDVAELVGGKAIFGHRVVTLSREVHAGLLAKDNATDRAELNKLGIPFIDLVCVDLYPLRAEIERKGSTPESVNNQTDIGGPTMLRSAAKGRRIVISQPEQRVRVLEWLRNGEEDAERFRRRLAMQAEVVAGEYALTSARYLYKKLGASAMS